MTRDELEIWIEANKNIKMSKFDELAGNFAGRIVSGFNWGTCKERNFKEWYKFHQHIVELAKYQSPTVEPSIISLLENHHKYLEIAAIELTLMFNWRKSIEGYDYWKEWCISIYKESNLKTD
jgi:hypothetical protein